MAGIDQRPTVGGLTVPFMVDERRSPIDFKQVDAAHVEDCAREWHFVAVGPLTRLEAV